ncbi:MAG: DUF1553 domain-containing protein [Limisphaerales bacterium]
MLALWRVGPGFAADFEFFEKRIRPVLVAECLQCHAGDKAKGNVRLDHRAAGQTSSSLIVPGKPSDSRLIQAIRHELPDANMPKDGARLDESVIADFEKWITAGAPDPRDKPATETAATQSWETTREFRKQWWSFQPIADPAIPTEGNEWSSHPVDRFVWQGMTKRGLRPGSPAARRTLVRRTYFALIGLPPSPKQLKAALNLPHSTLVEQLLASEHFGERWGRHWLDWFRYAESHGSEGDAPIPHAHVYRDYVIRALNSDVPYDQLIREHIAGDLLAKPRVNAGLGLNESAIGTAQLRMVQHGYQPTEPMMEMVRFVDDQIDVISKAFLGLTVSCARCHDHKFDPISQKDYYAMFGIFRSAMPAIVSINAPGQLERNRDELAALKPRIREAISDAWLQHADRIPELLTADDGWKKAIKESKADQPLQIWKRLAGMDDRQLVAEWNKYQSQQLARVEHRQDDMKARFRRAWNPTTIQSEWFRSGTAWRDGVTRAGEFFVEPDGASLIRSIYPRGIYSHLLSSKHNGQLHSPKFKLTSDSISVRVMGNDLAQVRLVVGNYPLPRGGIYGQKTQPWHEGPQWYKWDTRYWKGEEAHIEVATFDELTFFSQAYRGGRKPNTGDGRSYIGITDIVFDDDGQDKPAEMNQSSAPLFQYGQVPINKEQLAAHFREVAKACITAWKTRNLDDRQAAFLDSFLQQGLLPNSTADIPVAGKLVAEYRQLEADIPVAERSSGVLETVGINQPLLDRGDYKKPTAPVSRRFLEAFGAREYGTELSGRREFAEDIVHPDNPLVARVLVNRVWAYLFGEGSVSSTDNFGRLGTKPTHPELLDHLASWFARNGYSIKKLIAYITKTRSYQLSSEPSEQAKTNDPANTWLSHFRVRRLDAESLRDTLLATSGRLDRRMFGSPDSGSGNRRSIYVRAKRNSRDEFLKTFDTPEPLSTRSKRDVTNVPAQSLALLNNPFVKNSARVLGERLAGIEFYNDGFDTLFESILGRPPTQAELASLESMRRALLENGRKLRQKIMRVTAAQVRFRSELEHITHPIRESIRARRKTVGAKAVAGPQPYLFWNFEKDANDSRIGLKGKFFGDARISDGALVVAGGGSYVLSDPIPKELREKTLEVRVQLDNLNQRGGGVITIQSANGVIFDAIVFGEKQSRHWMAGSNGFSRTQSFRGDADDEAVDRPIHIVIVYSKDGTITGYRNGAPYGKPYKSSGPVRYAANQNIVGFGIRHLQPGGNRMLKGRILEARLYDRALSPDEVAAAAGQESEFVTERELRREMSDVQKLQYDRLKGQLAVAEAELESLNRIPVPNEKTVWAELAHAVYNLKEFIYLR